MSKKSRFRGPFENQHGKRAQTRFKSASRHLDHIGQSLTSQSSWKKSLLLTCQILELLVNTSAADEKYPVLNRDILTISIQKQLSHKQKTSLNFWMHFWNLDSILNILGKKMTLTAFVFPKLRILKTWLGKCLKSPASEDPSRSNMVNVPKHGSNLYHMVFFKFIDHCQVNWVIKGLFYWHAKSWEILLTHWATMKSILFLIETI